MDRMHGNKTPVAAAASQAVGASSCARPVCANIAILLDAILLASIFVALICLTGILGLSAICLLGLILALHFECPKEQRFLFS